MHLFLKLNLINATAPLKAHTQREIKKPTHVHIQKPPTLQQAVFKSMQKSGTNFARTK